MALPGRRRAAASRCGQRSAGCRWPRRAAVAGGRVSAGYGFSGAGSGSSKPHEQGECGQLRNIVSSKCPTVKSGGRISTARRRFLCGNAGQVTLLSFIASAPSPGSAPSAGSPRSWVTRIAGNGLAGQFFKDPKRRNPARRLASRRLKAHQAAMLGARQQGAQQAHPSRPLPAGERGQDRAGRSPPARRGWALPPPRFFASASPRTFSGSASCKFYRRRKWSNSNGSQNRMPMRRCRSAAYRNAVR